MHSGRRVIMAVLAAFMLMLPASSAESVVVTNSPLSRVVQREVKTTGNIVNVPITEAPRMSAIPVECATKAELTPGTPEWLVRRLREAGIIL